MGLLISREIKISVSKHSNNIQEEEENKVSEDNWTTSIDRIFILRIYI